MSQAARVDLSGWGEAPPLWVSLLAGEVERSSRTKAGARIGMSRVAVTLALQNRYPSGSTAGVERRVMASLGRIQCVAVDSLITAEQCQTYRERPAPTHNPHAMQHWRACQHCHHNPNCSEKSHARH